MTEVIGIDHIYITVSDMQRSEIFYDKVLINILGFRKNKFTLNNDPHIQYFNRHFGYIIRLARTQNTHDPYTPGLHHFCFRVNSIDEVINVSNKLNEAGIEASKARLYSEYAPDYWATYFTDLDNIRLEITNYRLERQERYNNW